MSEWEHLNGATHPGRGWLAHRRVTPDGRVLWIDDGISVLFCYSDAAYIGSSRDINEAKALCERGKREFEMTVVDAEPSPLTTTDQEFKQAKIKPVLKWTQIDKNNWHAAPVEGEALHARVRRLDDVTFAVYRDCRYVGGEPTLELAKKRAELNKLSEKNRCMRLWEQTNPGELPPFLVTTEAERAEHWRRNPPKRRDSVPSLKPPKPGVDPEVAEARAKARGAGKVPKPSELDPAAVLTVVNATNPKKAGSSAHARWALLLGGGHATVKDFLEAKGNPETLKNAVAKGFVKVGG